MADKQKTNAQWNRFNRATWAFFMRRVRNLYNQLYRYTRERTQIRNVNDAASATPHIAALSFTGVNYGVNTSLAGRLKVRFVANASNWDIQFHTAAGGATLVAQATNVAAGATGAVVAQNSSGLNGSITLGATITGDVTDKHEVVIDVDWALEASMRWPSDGDNDDDDASAAAARRANIAQASAVRSMISREVILLNELFISAEDNPESYGNAFLGTEESSLLDDTPSVSGTGVVSRIRLGFLPILFSAMADETLGSTQDVIRRIVDAQAATFGSNNDGQGSIADFTPEDHSPIGRLYGTCIAGHNDGEDVAGVEKFRMRFGSADSDETFSDETFSDLTVGQPWQGPLGLGTLTLARTFTKTDDGSNTKIGAASGITTTGATGVNTASGVLYGLVVDAGGSTYNYEFYKSEAGRSAGNQHGDLMARVAGVAASTATQATTRNGGPAINFTTGSSPSNGDTFSIDHNFFASKNASNESDTFEINFVLTSEGLIQALFSLALRFKLPSDTSGSEQVSDDEVKANVVHDYLTVDV